MKKLLVIVLAVTAFVSNAQSKDEKELVARTYLLSNTVFGTKDSLTLEDLFAKQATYGHSHGNLQTRAEAIASISKNKSKYTDTSVTILKVLVEKNTAIVRHLFKAKENKADGSVTPLNFTMMLVWIKEKGKWRLMGRQAVIVS
jgi:ketosteroid isomerase-like protein